MKDSSRNENMYILLRGCTMTIQCGPIGIKSSNTILFIVFSASLLILKVDSWTSQLSTARVLQHRRNLSPSAGRSALLMSSSASSSSPLAESPSTSTSTTRPLPRVVPLPPPIYSTTPGTWAHDTMSRRIHTEILQRTFDENQATLESPAFAPLLAKFIELKSQLQSSSPLEYLDPLPEDTNDSANGDDAPEWQLWNQLLRPFVEKGDNWLTAPWLVSEFYVYRRLMQALGYFDKTSPGYRWDPFYTQKRAGWQSSVTQAEPLLRQLETTVQQFGVTVAFSFSLWGNQMDLSLWPVDASEDDATKDKVELKKEESRSIHTAASEYLLHDDSNALSDYCYKTLQTKTGGGGGHVDIIVDNAGLELVIDLILAQYLIESKLAQCVTFQLKSHPTFVSDAMERDLRETVDYYATSLDASQYPACVKAGKIWKQMLETGQWKCQEHSFWVQPHPMWDMPLASSSLYRDLQQRCDLAVVKGDANYRRLLGDLQFPMTTEFDDVVGAYFPCPVVALRTLKSELGCGITAEKVQHAQNLHSNDWMVNGKFGVIQFTKGIRPE